MDITPERILQTGLAFWNSKTLLSAVEMELFTELAKHPADLATLQGRLGLHPRAARDFLDALVALGFLQRNNAVYQNTPETELFLDKAKPSYVGGMLEMAVKVASLLATRGVSIRVLSMPTLRPLDRDRIIAACYGFFFVRRNHKGGCCESGNSARFSIDPVCKFRERHKSNNQGHIEPGSELLQSGQRGLAITGRLKAIDGVLV